MEDNSGKRYYNVDDNKLAQVLGLLACFLVPFIGPYFYGTRFTSRSHLTLAIGGLVYLGCFMLHIMFTVLALVRWVF